MDKLERARLLRQEADRLGFEAIRNVPDKWRVGQRIRFLKDSEFRWKAGEEAEIVAIADEDKDKEPHEYQHLTTSPDSSNALWWTTPNDIELATV